LVKHAAARLVKYYPEYNELLDIVKLHDSSKFKDPELDPYIELTWKKKNNDKSITSDIKAATLHHCFIQKHHPEYWTSEGYKYRSRL
jgi:hypothetical protein